MSFLLAGLIIAAAFWVVVFITSLLLSGGELEIAVSVATFGTLGVAVITGVIVGAGELVHLVLS